MSKKKSNEQKHGDPGSGKVILIVGSKGTGKTDICRKFIPKGTKLLVCEFSPFSVAWQDIALGKSIDRGGRFIIQRNDDEFWRDVYYYFHGGTLVMDDARNYMNAQIQGYLRSVVIDCRKKWLNVILIVHSWMEIPPFFFSMCDILCLFANTGSIDGRRGDINNFEKWKATQMEVNRTGGMIIKSMS